jgi:hypothetical protein
MEQTIDKKQERGVVHLTIKATGEHFYYGNLKALFDNHEIEENDGSLGSAYNYVKNYDFSNGDGFLVGNIKFIRTVFRCNKCDKTYTIKEVKENDIAINR